MARLYPALACRWPASPPAAELDRLLALLDDHSPTAVEEKLDGLRVLFATAPARALRAPPPRPPPAPPPGRRVRSGRHRRRDRGLRRRLGGAQPVLARARAGWTV